MAPLCHKCLTIRLNLGFLNNFIILPYSIEIILGTYIFLRKFEVKFKLDKNNTPINILLYCSLSISI